MSRTRQWCAAAVVLVVALAGCTAGDGDVAPTSARPSYAMSAVLVEQNAPELLRQAEEAVTAAGSVRVHDTGTTLLGVDVTFGPGGIATGSFDAFGVVEFRRTVDGTVYARGDAAFYAGPLASGAGVDLSSIAGRWVVVTDDAPAPLATVGRFADLEALVGTVFAGTGPAAFVATEVVGADLALRITRADVGDLVLDTQHGHRPLRWEARTGTVDFDRYGDPVTVEAPPASEIVAVPV